MDRTTLIAGLIKDLQEDAAWKALDMDNNPDDDADYNSGWLAGMKNAVTLLEDKLEEKEIHAA